ncbi:hypothetical protein HanXRQr2_Chr03g0094621 [Helianthus annuus]|uniref:Uncharacterized protein n=1 Tax=Helianthus annuus TaxID=4232 RepID=A0A9K3JDX2_HELAN|nr:hypothetical protein HanXRQr2_Chr03g0094621 [Helianthus annuus]
MSFSDYQLFCSAHRMTPSHTSHQTVNLLSSSLIQQSFCLFHHKFCKILNISNMVFQLQPLFQLSSQPRQSFQFQQFSEFQQLSLSLQSSQHRITMELRVGVGTVSLALVELMMAFCNFA